MLAGAPSLARAAELELNDPASCTSLDELSFRVSRALGQPLERVGDRRFTVDIRRKLRGFHAQLTTSGGGVTGESALRQLSAASCDELVDALALAIALASSAQVAPGDSVPAPSRAEAPLAEAPPPSPADPSAISEKSRDAHAETPGSTVRAAVALSALADTGSLPGAGFGGAVAAQVGFRSIELRAQVLLLPAREAVVDASAPESPGGRLSLIAGALSICTPLAEARFIDVSACVGAELGRLSGTGTGVTTPHARHRPWAAARLDLGARWPLPSVPLGLEFTVTLAAPLLRDDFVLNDIGTVHHPPNVLGRAGLGLAWSFF